MTTPKISLIVGVGNNGYCLELCIKSFMRHNAEFTEEIIIANNSSTDFSLDFIKTLPYNNIIKIINYFNNIELNAKIPISMYEHIHVGLNNCKTEWALLTHVDVNWKLPVVPKFHEILTANPDLYMTGLTGIAGFDPNSPTAIIHNGRTNGCRFHEWLLFINVPIWKSEYIRTTETHAYSFEGRFEQKIFYDTGAWMYKNAYNSGKKLITFDVYENNGPHITNFECGSRADKQKDSMIAKNILEKEYQLCNPK
jgi:glycosyltransferase involved in cell wall biosynthesis